MTPEENKILRELPAVLKDGSVDSRKTLDYLASKVFKTTPEELKQHSLDFKTAILETLGKCGESAKKEVVYAVSQQEFNKITASKPIGSWDGKDDKILQDKVKRKFPLVWAQDKRPQIIGNYGNKIFAAISDKEVEPTQEIEAFRKDPDLISGVDRMIEKVADRMTVVDCESQLHESLD